MNHLKYLIKTYNYIINMNLYFILIFLNRFKFSLNQ